MNLQNPDCRREVEKEIGRLIREFDWDGVNVAELYFESLEGASNPARFTPMNDDVRAEFEQVGGFDPKLFFDPSSPIGTQRIQKRCASSWISGRTWLRACRPTGWTSSTG